MKNFIAIVIMSIVLLSSYTIAGGTRPPENKYVKCDIVLQKKQLKAGTTGQLLITLKPIAGIHVNITPPAEVKLDSTNIIAGVGKPFDAKPNRFARRKLLQEDHRPILNFHEASRPGRFA